MKKATVVYLAQASEIPVEIDIDGAVERAGFDPRWTEIAGLAPGFHSPESALLALAKRGASRIDLARAFYDRERGLVVGEARSHLTG